MDAAPRRPGTRCLKQFFNAVKALSEAIFESEKQINDNVALTKYTLHEGNVELGFRFNEFLHLSEFKFTENVPTPSSRKFNNESWKRKNRLSRKSNKRPSPKWTCSNNACH
jgi:hypothetical protein